MVPRREDAFFLRGGAESEMSPFIFNHGTRLSPPALLVSASLP